MLPVHRLIAHKEWGNTPPGGYPGRKTDPVYDMNWRRARVAAFKPRGGFPMALSDAEQAELLRLVRNIHHQEKYQYDYQAHPDKLVDDQYGHTMSIRKGVALVVSMLTEIAKRQGMSREEIKALIEETLAENVVKVDVAVRGGGTGAQAQ